MEHTSRENATADLIVQAIGDVSLNGMFCYPGIHAPVSQNMAKIASLLGECDLRIANWEAPLWGDGGINVLKVPRLCTTLEAARSVLPLKLDVALLANNHAYDCLEKGFENTIRFLEGNGITWLGAGRCAEQARAPLVLIRKGLRIGLLNYVAPDTHPNIPPDCGFHLNLFEEARVLADVNSLKRETNVVLVAVHWGVDFSRYPTPAQRRFARRLIEAGASLVIGAHAHCLQGHESWKEGHVFYGLGNFLFGELPSGERWPEVSRRSAVAACVLRGSVVERVSLLRFRQDRLIVSADRRRSRLAEEKRLNNPLRLDDGRYERFWRRSRTRDALVGRPLRFVQSAGGLIPAIRRLRWRHVRSLGRAICGESKADQGSDSCARC